MSRTSSHGPATSPPGRTPAASRRPRYHHGHLRQALIEEAVRVIQAQGVEGLTLRAAGAALGVSRTALYRHFSDKSALLAAVAAQGFRTLRLETLRAWEAEGRGREGFAAMGVAYVDFAVAHPSHYRVMFSGFLKSAPANADFAENAAAAFQVLVDALVAQQREALVRDDDPVLLARFIWSLVHGIAMLAIDGLLGGPHGDARALTRFAVGRVSSGISPS